MAVPLDPTDWSSDASRAKFTFACTASGVAAKCARNWGYKPWKTTHETLQINGVPVADQPVDLAPLYDACLIAARADYCQDGASYTKNGTLVDLFDSIDGVDSINPTAGLPFEPYTAGPMMHEEYQVSTANHVFTPAQTAAITDPVERSLSERLLLSGMQSSRYADLDPGRSCFAAPHIDRCDPKEPYACYRATNMGARPYGAFIAVNSPRHCSHDELTSGEPLDPLCNECVRRICEIDPTCCGDPGNTFYPGSLVWDDHCEVLHDQVCRSAPVDATLPPDDPRNLAWPVGEVAPPAGSHPVVFLNGAVGSFERIVMQGTTPVVEGWACDPDFPGASIAVQISVGGALGSTGQPPATTIADKPLVPAWRSAAAAACGPGRHGFSFPLAAGTHDTDVYVYGIDLNVPGAPFTLLRGGKKTVPGSTPAPTMRAAIWTGWLEPSASGNYSFCKQLPGATGTCTPVGDINPSGQDRYRVWVNGIYVAGNWVDEDPSAPGAFTLAPPSAPVAVYLQKGVHYGVRVEYLRADPAPSDSAFTLLWSTDNLTFASIPTSALYAVGQGVGNGLLGNFFATTDLSGTPVGQSIGAVDTVWTKDNLPAPGIVLADGFGATFEGQVVPPISGDYTFTADTDGAVKIFVKQDDGTMALATDASRRPPGAGNGDVCSHDICVPGGAISHTCNQGFFCSGMICLKDPACCSQTWDARCVQEVAEICNLTCSPNAPTPMTLRAGVKYDIRVEYQHAAGTGAKLRLMWALPGGPRDVVPAQRLFAATDAPAPAIGVGLNAAYFSDAAFTNEFLDRVDTTVDTTATPSTTSIICGPPCTDGGDSLGAPALVEPAAGRRVAGPSVLVKGRGAGRNATVRLFDAGALIATTSTAADGGDGGFFSLTVSLGNGAHALTATQAADGLTSAPSDALSFQVGSPVDPAAPGPPSVAQPPGGLVSGNGDLSVGGTASPGAVVTVKSGATTIGTFTADANGHWGGTVTLPGSGIFTLSVTQTSSGHTSEAGPEVTARVALPPLTVDAPLDRTTVTSAVTISGHAQDMGPVLVADGDGRFFVERASLPLVAGAFSGPLSLDYGQHVLKIFQRAGGLDGDGIIRTVTVAPPVGSLRITSVDSGFGAVSVSPPPAVPPTIDPGVRVRGTGGLPRKGAGGTGRRGSVIVYQGNVAVGQAPLDDSGGFVVDVTLAGAGLQLLSVSQVIPSLSGGGAAESARTDPSVPVVVRPGAPTIDAPKTGLAQTELDVTVAGTAVAGSTVSIMDSTALGKSLLTQVPSVASDPLQPTIGSFAAPLHLTNGSHRLTAFQSFSGVDGPESVPVVISVGDVTPPKIDVVSSQLNATATDDSGATVDIAGNVSAHDGATTVPVTCVPAASPTPHFAIGSTRVICSASDSAGNRTSATFTVLVRDDTLPDIEVSGLSAPAQSKEGAPVNFQLGATGWIADCSPPGSPQPEPCQSWRMVNNGIGLSPQDIFIDPNSDTLYTTLQPDQVIVDNANVGTQLIASSDQGVTWQKMPKTGHAFTYPVLGAGTPSHLYGITDGGGILLSHDGGQTYTRAVDGLFLRGLAVDPRDPLHVLAWSDVQANASHLLETRDGWATWSEASAGLPTGTDVQGRGLRSTQIWSVALDPLNPDRAYLALGDYLGGASARLYRRIGDGPWERRAPPATEFQNQIRGNETLVIASKLEPCPSGHDCQKFPTVFAGSLASRDGGDTWVPYALVPQPFYLPPDSLVVDRTDPEVVYAANQAVYRSLDGGRTWTQRSTPFLASSLIQDVKDPNTLYASTSDATLARSTDGGATWSKLESSQLSLSIASPKDLVVDPGNAQVAYLLTLNGVYKTADGGASWHARNLGIAPNLGSFTERLSIDPFDPQKIYLSTEGFVYSSPDGAGDDNIGWTQLQVEGLVALDPLARGAYYAAKVGATSDGFLEDSVTKNANGAPRLLTPEGNFIGNALIPYKLQILGDAARTLLLSWYDQQDLNSADTAIFSGVALEQNQFGIAHAQQLGIGLANPVLANVDGAQVLYVGGAAFGDLPTKLYRAPVSTFDWQVVGTLPDATPFPENDFNPMTVDPGSGAIYTIDGYDLLWESHDGGHTWTQDSNQPGLAITHVWVSPPDGALYAAVSTFGMTTPEFRQAQLRNPAETGELAVLWKRSRAEDPPAGARLLRGDVHVTCTGADGRTVTPGATFPIGDTLLTCSATDIFHNTRSLPITITVRDTTPPTVFVPSQVAVSSSDPTNVDFSVSAVDAIDGQVPFDCDHASGDPFPVGATLVHCSATDKAGNTGRASFPVIVSTDYPSITVPGDLTADAVDEHGAVVTFTVTARDGFNQPIDHVCTPDTGSQFPLGVTEVDCHATAGVTVTKVFHVTVRDTKAPVISVPGPQVASADGPQGARVTFNVTATDAVAGSVPVTCDPASGSLFPLGTTTVTCHASDPSGNTSTERFDVTVKDFSPPVLQLADVIAEADDQTGARVTFTATATDAEDGTIKPDCVPPSGSWFPLGDTLVACSAADSAHNESRGTFTVRVVDRTPPTVTVPAKIVAEATAPEGAPVSFAASAFDLVSGAVTPACAFINLAGTPVPIASGATFPLGDTIVTCRATDAGGNTASASFTVSVRDTQAPRLTLPDSMTVPADGSGTAVVTFSATALDTVAGALPVGCTPKSGSRFVAGATLVSCSARDGASNEATGTFTVTVNAPPPRGPGDACTSGAQCASGFCADGVCCQTACSGSAGDCQACSIAAGGTINGTCTPVQAGHVCRAGAGACDVAETCDGISTACPGDALAPAGHVCRDSTGVCDPAETCTGSSPACPTDAFAPAGQTCRAAAGACDVAEACTGTSAACPADVLVPAGQTCRAAAGACDVAEACTGLSALCPADAFAPPTQTCRPSAGICDVAENCTGSAPTCPADAFAPPTQTCRAAAGACDVAESCTGASAACPPDAFLSAGTVCAAAGTCQTPGVCSGAAAACPGPAPIPGCKTDTTPPHWSNVPGTIVAYATCAGGATVTYTKPTATDDVDGVRPVSCAPASGGMFAPGKTTVTCTASDNSSNSSSVTFTIWVKFQAPADGTFFLQPINADGTSVFKLGSTVPVKFALQGASAGITDLVAHLTTVKNTSMVDGTFMEAVSTAASDSGNAFRYDPTAKQYIFNLSTKKMTTGTWSLRADLGDLVDHVVQISLR